MVQSFFIFVFNASKKFSWHCILAIKKFERSSSSVSLTGRYLFKVNNEDTRIRPMQVTHLFLIVEAGGSNEIYQGRNYQDFFK